jgi:hypothetical protein
LNSCNDNTLDDVYSVYDPRAISLTLTDGLPIASEYEAREDSRGNPGLFVPADELQS